MTPAEILALSAPVSDEEPCGPDLEALGDLEYMRFVARIEGALPKTFASFKREDIDFKAEFATMKSLLDRSRDLRLLTTLAKLMILNRDVPGFLAATQTIETLLTSRWEHVHPQLLDGDPILRTITVQMLDDAPDSVMPLQSAPLFETRRFGKASFRHHLLASGQIQGRTAANENEKDEVVPSQNAISAALDEADLGEMTQARGLMIDLRDTLARTEIVIAEKADQPGAVKFEKLKELAQGIIVFLDGAISIRDPSLALGGAAVGAAADNIDGDEAAPGGVAGPIKSLPEAIAALAGAARYFATFEPSSPILLLIGQAEALIGKSFYDAMLALMPDLSSQAAIRFGQGTNLRLPLDRLSALPPPTTGDDAPAQDGWSGAEMSPAADAAEDSSGEAGESDGGETDNPSFDGPAEALPETPTSNVGAQAHTTNLVRVQTRHNAMALLDQVAGYFRAAEPSSPVPPLLDHARALAGRDFFGLLREMLPASALRVDE